MNFEISPQTYPNAIKHINIRLLPFVDFDLIERAIESGHERPKQIIITPSNRLAIDAAVILYTPFIKSKIKQSVVPDFLRYVILQFPVFMRIMRKQPG